MSELISNRASYNFHRQLLATASALALASYLSSAAKAEDAGRPTVWIELGGQMEAMQGTSTPFMAPFMTANSPLPDVYGNKIFTDTQRPARNAFGLEGKASFQPESSDWVFLIGIRYGRAQTNRHVHQSGPQVTHSGSTRTANGGYVAHARAFADAKSSDDESHMILDFTAGKDVGLGAFGRESTSVISAGVRFAQFSNRSKTGAIGRPEINVGFAGFNLTYSFFNYTMAANAARSFHGIGPSLSWNASATLFGDKDNSEITFDWGINGAVLFGRQRTKTNHTTQAYHLPITQNYAGQYDAYYYTRIYRTEHQHSRSRGVTVPNFGGFAGLSLKFPNAKFSLGYRADFFLGAVDAGIDERHSKDLGFNGPFASISIGLGG